jgi:transglutaminase-like putative cysteine protease
VLYSVRHRTSYRYGRPVDLGVHLLHLSPRTLPSQRVLRADLVPTPAPDRVEQGTDTFGNAVTWMFLEAPHAAFEVRLEAVVEVRPRAAPPPAATLGWRDVAAIARERPEWHATAEFLFDSPMVAVAPEITAYAALSFGDGRSVIAGLLDLNSRIRRDFAFRPGSTTLSSTPRTVFAQRSGVCQDFAHLMIAGLRGIGLPARYVSGYVRTYPAPGQPRRRGADQSHAWVGAWMGPEHGWIDLDPTNDLIVADEHVTLGWGRDYGDVSPVRGVILGGGAHSVEAAVDLEPLAADASSIPAVGH